MLLLKPQQFLRNYMRKCEICGVAISTTRFNTGISRMTHHTHTHTHRWQECSQIKHSYACVQTDSFCKLVCHEALCDCCSLCSVCPWQAGKKTEKFIISHHPIKTAVILFSSNFFFFFFLHSFAILYYFFTFFYFRHLRMKSVCARWLIQKRHSLLMTSAKWKIMHQNAFVMSLHSRSFFSVIMIVNITFLLSVQ